MDEQKTGKHIYKMVPGWLFPYLVDGDQLFGTKRWQYWKQTLLDLKIPDGPIPHVQFLSTPHRETVKHIAAMLKRAEQRGIRHNQAFESLVVWILHGLGDPEFREYETADQVPDVRVDVEVLDFWYEKFELGRLQMYQYDYMAHFAQGAENRNYNPYEGFGFFATPMTLARMMAEVTFDGADREKAKRESVCDPCCGTGTLLLAASNYSLNLYGQDLSLSMVRMCRLNGWLYAPWMVFWPDFSILFGPTKAQMKEVLFGRLVWV